MWTANWFSATEDFGCEVDLGQRMSFRRRGGGGDGGVGEEGEWLMWLWSFFATVDLCWRVGVVQGCLSGEEEEEGGGGGRLSGEENVGEEEGGGRQIVVQSFSRRQEAAGAGHTVRLDVPVFLTGYIGTFEETACSPNRLGTFEETVCFDLCNVHPFGKPQKLWRRLDLPSAKKA